MANSGAAKRHKLAGTLILGFVLSSRGTERYDWYSVLCVGEVARHSPSALQTSPSPRPGLHAEMQRTSGFHYCLISHATRS